MKLGTPYRTVWVRVLVGVNVSEASEGVEILVKALSLSPVSIGLLGSNLAMN